MTINASKTYTKIAADDLVSVKGVYLPMWRYSDIVNSLNGLVDLLSGVDPVEQASAFKVLNFLAGTPPTEKSLGGQVLSRPRSDYPNLGGDVQAGALLNKIIPGLMGGVNKHKSTAVSILGRVLNRDGEGGFTVTSIDPTVVKDIPVEFTVVGGSAPAPVSA